MKSKKCDIYERFDNIRSFINYIESRQSTPTFRAREYSDTKDFEFTKTNSLQQATDLILYGDKDLAKRIEDKGVSKLRTQIYRQQVRRQIYSSVVGCAPNVPAYIAGAPNSMIAYRQTKVRQKVVNVAYNCAVFGGVDAENILSACANLVCALMKIEASGTSVNLYAVNLDETNDGTVSFSIRIKTSGQRFDVLKMAYPIAHPSMNRRHKFRFTEVTPDVPRSFIGGYGRPETSNEKIKTHFNRHGLNIDAAYNYETVTGKTPDQLAHEILSGGKA